MLDEIGDDILQAGKIAFDMVFFMSRGKKYGGGEGGRTGESATAVPADIASDTAVALAASRDKRYLGIIIGLSTPRADWPYFGFCSSFDRTTKRLRCRALFSPPHPVYYLRPSSFSPS